MADGLSHNQRCALSTVAAQISGGHSHFPVLFTRANLPTEMFDADGSHPAQNGGGDIRFSSESSGTDLLPCEIVSFVTDDDPANGSAEIWVRVPDVRNTQADTIYVWWSIPDLDSQPPVGSPHGRNAVWPDYHAVWHGDDVVDSTGNGHILAGAGNPNAGVPGKVGKAFSFDGSSYYETSAVWNDEPVTLSAWFRLNSATGNQTIISSGVGAGDGFQRMAFISAGLLRNQKQEPTQTSQADTSDVVAGSWFYGVAASSSDASRQIALNHGPAVSDGTSIADAAYAHTNIGVLNEAGAPVQFLNGLADEVRVAAFAVSDEWRATEYANQNDPGAFISVGVPESVGGEAVLAVQGAALAQVAGTAGIGQGHVLAVETAGHGLLAGSVALDDDSVLTSGSAVHGHQAGGAGLFQQHLLMPAAAGHGHMAAGVLLVLASAGAPVGRTLGVAVQGNRLCVSADLRSRPVNTAG